MRLISNLKQMVVPAGRQPRKVLAGPFKDITMQLSLQTQSQIYVGLFERETYGWLNSLSVGIATAIDIGSAYGEYTLYFLLKTKAKVFAFDPETTSVEALKGNLELNGVQGTDRLNISNSFVGAATADRTVSLDSLASQVTSPCLVKMDVNGAEEEILKGASLLNQLPQVRWLIETHSIALENVCVKMLEAAGFKTAIIPNAWWRIFIPEMRHVEQNRWLAAWKPSDLPGL